MFAIIESKMHFGEICDVVMDLSSICEISVFSIYVRVGKWWPRTIKCSSDRLYQQQLVHWNKTQNFKGDKLIDLFFLVLWFFRDCTMGFITIKPPALGEWFTFSHQIQVDVNVLTLAKVVKDYSDRPIPRRPQANR